MSKEKLYTFYIVECVLSGKSYIGCTSYTLDKRWKDHLSQAKTYPTTNFHKAMSDIGAEHFYPRVIETGLYDRKGAVIREEELITLYKTREDGYNMSWSRKKEQNGWFGKGASNSNFTDRSKNPSCGKIQDTCKPLSADGLTFISISHAGKHFNLTNGAIKFRCLSESKRFKNWFFLEEAQSVSNEH